MAIKFPSFNFLRPLHSQSESFVPSVPDGQRIYAVGDIHGRVDLLGRLHHSIRKHAIIDSANISKTIVYLGDYVDRGFDSKEVINFLLGARLGDINSVYLKGNHEDVLLRFLEDASLGPAWFAIGGNATALSYGVNIPRELSAEEKFQYVRQQLRQLIPPDHLAFFKRLDLTYEAGDYFFVHAGIRCGVPLELQHPKDLLWIRDEFLRRDQNCGKVIVHGHSISHRPEVKRNRIGIDTGAYATNTLTCLVLEGASRAFISTDANNSATWTDL